MKKEEMLKSRLFESGYEAISGALGYDYPEDEDKDVTDNRLDEAFQQMPDPEFEKLYVKYCGVPEIRLTAYKLYQLDWMMRHGYGIHDLVMNIQEEWESAHVEYGSDAEDMPIQLYEGCFSRDESWVCYDEFMANEYRDKDYMLELFAVPGNTNELREAYYEDIGYVPPRHGRVAMGIVWDTDGVSVDDLPEDVSIPDDVEDDEVCDYLSDVYGWCVEGFNIKVKEV